MINMLSNLHTQPQAHARLSLTTGFLAISLMRVAIAAVAFMESMSAGAASTASISLLSMTFSSEAVLLCAWRLRQFDLKPVVLIHVQ